MGEAVKDILPKAVEVIESLQPYHRGARFKEHPLWILNRLCIIDKHRTIALNSVALTGNVIGEHGVGCTWRKLNYGGELWVSLSHRNKIDFKPDSPQVIVGEPVPGCYGGFEIRIERLATVHDFVRDDVIPKFAAFFK